MNYELAGARLVEIKYGLVADLPVRNPYTTPYYISLEFRRGVEFFNDLYPVSGEFPRPYLHPVGKSLKYKHKEVGKTFYTFTDDSIMTIGE
ncbi:hypothetical protein QT972_22755 [Microcoleus sp. herbarium7]